MKSRKHIVKLLAMLVIVLFNITFITTQASANGKYGRLTGVNWYGFETGNLVPHGLWARDYKSMLQQIKDLGFNVVRLPWCVDALTGTPSSIQINAYGVDAYTGITGMNLDLEGLNSMAVMDKIIDYANTLGLKIIMDCHSLAHDGYMDETLWYRDAYPESTWINAWKTIVTRYKSYPNVIGCDLKNEPHGNLGQGQKPPATWGYDCPGYTNTDWKAAAERCGQAILAINPNLVIIVEGVEMAEDQSGYWWGGNLKDVPKYPITAIPAANLEYSYHEYCSNLYNQTWFSDPNYPNNLPAVWDEHFYNIHKQGIGQLLMGEFSIQESQAADPNSVDYKWLVTLLSYLGKNVDFTFWCWNTNGDWSILGDDMVTVYPAKYNLIKPYLAGNTDPTSTPDTETPTPTPGTETPTPNSGLKGDANGSGTIDIVDALLVAQYYVGLNPANFNTVVADVNCSGGIDIVDALVIAQFYVGLITVFPC